MVMSFPTQNVPTVFVDNLPHQIRKIWVFNLFSRYGKIKDIFIPQKRSKVSGQSFGFVRYFKYDDAVLAVEKSNKLCVWNHRLEVKFAKFLRKEDTHGVYGRMQKKSQNVQRGKEVWRRKGIIESSKQGEIWNNEATLNQSPSEKSAIISIHSSSNGWLLRSAIATIRRMVSTSDLEIIFRREGYQNVQVKPLGGRSVLITFPDVKSRDQTIKEKWILNWFEQINPWNGEQASEERFVWLSCFGMPLNAWSVSSFKEIGNVWGHFIQVDESTLKEKSFAAGNILIATENLQIIEGIIELVVDGISFNVRVKEEDSFRIISQNLFSDPELLSMEKGFDEGKDKEGDDDMSKPENEGNKSAVLVSKIDDKAMEDNSNGNVACSDEKESSGYNQNSILGRHLINEAVSDTISSSSGIGESSMGNERVMDSFGEAIPHNASSNLSVDDMNSSTPPATLINNEINVDNQKATSVEKEEDLVGGSIEPTPHEVEIFEPQVDHLVEENQDSIQAAIKGVKGKKKRKTINEILGCSKLKQDNKKGGKKCVLFRSVVAAAALSASVSSNGINNRNKILLDEAQAVWQVNKLYMNYDGDEDEVISKIAELRAQDNTKTDHQL